MDGRRFDRPGAWMAPRDEGQGSGGKEVLPTELPSQFLPNYDCRDFGAEMMVLPNC